MNARLNARFVAIALGLASLVASGTYVFIYLHRWEWNRALISGVIFVAAEIALVTVLINSRLRRLGAETASLRAQLREERTLSRLQSTAPEPRDHFTWIARPERMNVFVPVLMGAGLVLSAVAWSVERVARATARPALERGLAHQLGTLELPEGGFVPPDTTLDRMRRPVGRPPG